MKMNFKKSIALVICMALTFLLFVACAAPPAEENTSQPEVLAEIDTNVSEPEPMQDEPEEDNKNTVSFTDMAGRTVEVPTVINKVYGTDPVASITMYALAPDKLLGWNYKLSEYESAYILPEYLDLPVYGMRDNFNPEAVIQDAPDLVLQMGNTNDKAVEDAEALQEQLNIPIVILSGNVGDIPEALTLFGGLIGDETRAGELAAYATRTIDRAKEMAIPEDDRVTVYYGNGIDSLETAPAGTVASEVIELAGGSIVTDIEVESPSDRIAVSKEQVISWNPQFMFVNGEPKENIFGSSAAEAIMNDIDFSTVQAVVDENVYGIPKAPFSWLDRPKALNRLIGITWAGSVMYPDLYADIDIEQEIKDFYQLFYHMELTDEQLGKLMET